MPHTPKRISSQLWKQTSRAGSCLLFYDDYTNDYKNEIILRRMKFANCCNTHLKVGIIDPDAHKLHKNCKIGNTRMLQITIKGHILCRL